MEEREDTRTARRQLKAMLRKNWLLKIRHPFVTLTEVLLPTVVMLMLIGIRTRVDTQIHPAEPLPFQIFSELWLAKEFFSVIDLFVQASFPGATSQGCNGLSVKYQLPYGEDLSLADVFGLIE